MNTRNFEKLSIINVKFNEDKLPVKDVKKQMFYECSNIIYCLKKKCLIGIITLIDIFNNGSNEYININKSFIKVVDWNESLVTKIFNNKTSVYSIPVINSDGELLGDYQCQYDYEYAMAHADVLKITDRSILKEVCGQKGNLIYLVKPFSSYNYKIYEAFVTCFENLNFSYQTITRTDVLDMVKVTVDDNALFIFVDNIEKKIEEMFLERNLNSCTCCYILQQIEYRTFIRGLLDILYEKRDIIKTFIINELETPTGYLKKYQMLKSSNSQDTITADNAKDFLAELYTDDYFSNIVEDSKHINSTEAIINMIKEMQMACDTIKNELEDDFDNHKKFCLVEFIRSLFLGVTEMPPLHNVKQKYQSVIKGKRRTVNNKTTEYDNHIWCFDNCFMIGSFVEDKYTIPSLLQLKINQFGDNYECTNCATYDIIATATGFSMANNIWKHIMANKIKPGDIVVIYYMNYHDIRFPSLNIASVAENNHIPLGWTLDALYHSNHKFNQLIVEQLYLLMKPYLTKQYIDNSNVINFDWKRKCLQKIYIQRYIGDIKNLKELKKSYMVLQDEMYEENFGNCLRKARQKTDILILFLSNMYVDTKILPWEKRRSYIIKLNQGVEGIRILPMPSEYLIDLDKSDFYTNFFQQYIKWFVDNILNSVGISVRILTDIEKKSLPKNYLKVLKQSLDEEKITIIELD